MASPAGRRFGMHFSGHYVDMQRIILYGYQSYSRVNLHTRARQRQKLRARTGCGRKPLTQGAGWVAVCRMHRLRAPQRARPHHSAGGHVYSVAKQLIRDAAYIFNKKIP